MKERLNGMEKELGKDEERLFLLLIIFLVFLLFFITMEY
jgi:hypothetical protein